MKNVQLIRMMLIGSLLTPAVLWADDMTATDTMKHPVTAYDAHEVKSDAQDTAVYSQKMKETKAALDQAQKDVAAAQDDTVRAKAQKRVDMLQKKYDRLAKKKADEKKDLGVARQDLQQDQKPAN